MTEFDTTVAVEQVVSAMSDKVVRELLTMVASAMLGDCGDVSNESQMRELVVQLASTSPSPYLIPDPDKIRPVLAAAATMCSMQCGPGPSDVFVATLAAAACTGRTFDHIIH